MAAWPSSGEELVEIQRALARASPPPWTPPPRPLLTGGCFVCFPRGEPGPGHAGDRAWAAAALMHNGRHVAGVVVPGEAGAAYEPGLLALREGPLLEAAVRALPEPPDVLLVDATGRDHPRAAGLALHLGAAVGIPTVGVTHRPLVAQGGWPSDQRGASSPLAVRGETVGLWLRTKVGTRPLAVHAAWRTDPETAAAVVNAATVGARTPEPLRHARRLARTARARMPR